MSALAHGVESLYAPDSTAQSLDVAEEAIGALARGLSRAVSQPSDLKARTETHCEVLGSPVGPWQHHHGTPPQTAHVHGGRYQLPHAGVHSALLPQVTAFNAPSAGGPFSRAARALRVAAPAGVGPALNELAIQLQAPTSLAQLGLELDAIDPIGKAVATAPGAQSQGLHQGRRLLRAAAGGCGKKPPLERN
jgi:maleylacetate reductase